MLIPRRFWTLVLSGLATMPLANNVYGGASRPITASRVRQTSAPVASGGSTVKTPSAPSSATLPSNPVVTSQNNASPIATLPGTNPPTNPIVGTTTSKPPIDGVSPVAGKIPVTSVPPINGIPPVVGKPPVQKLPPINGIPPIAGKPPVQKLPPINGIPPIAGKGTLSGTGSGTTTTTATATAISNSTSINIGGFGGGGGDGGGSSDGGVSSGGSAPVDSTPVANPAPVTQETVRIVNPVDTTVTLSFRVAGQSYHLAAGKVQELSVAPNAVIEFDRGNNGASGRYALAEGNYVFAAAQGGWDLYRLGETLDANPPVPAR